MHPRNIILNCLLLGLTTARTLSHGAVFPAAPSRSVLKWAPCPSEILEATKPSTNATFDCTTLDVPLDYTLKSSESLQLQLLRVKATKKPRKGNVLFNPGGPGGSGVEALLDDADRYLDILGGHFDVIGFDPRGAGQTIPFNCNFTGASNGTIFSRQTRDSLPQFDAGKTITNKTLKEEASFADACFKNQKEYGRYIGTPFVARDMLAIVDALDKGGKLNYFGVSYGSALGQVFASMFPDRIGRMLLDGTLLATDYVTTMSSRTTRDTEKCLNHLFSECIEAGPRICRLANYSGPHTSSLDLTTALTRLFEELINNPTLPPNSGLSTKDYPYGGVSILNKLKGNIANSLGAPTSYPSAVEMIYFALEHKWKESFNATISEPASKWNRGIDAFNGVLCLDTTFRATSLDDLYSMVQTHLLQGTFADSSLKRLLRCSQWRFDPPERINLSKLQNVTTSFPILFTNGLYDPITPVSSAFEASSGFRDSRVLLHEGVGHGMLAHPSNCTWNAVREYFEDGTLPRVGTVCKQPMLAFKYLRFLVGKDKV